MIEIQSWILIINGLEMDGKSRPIKKKPALNLLFENSKAICVASCLNAC